jgi:hypothetical protein
MAWYFCGTAPTIFFCNQSTTKKAKFSSSTHHQRAQSIWIHATNQTIMMVDDKKEMTTKENMDTVDVRHEDPDHVECISGKESAGEMASEEGNKILVSNESEAPSHKESVDISPEEMHRPGAIAISGTRGPSLPAASSYSESDVTPQDQNNGTVDVESHMQPVEAYPVGDDIKPPFVMASEDRRFPIYLLIAVLLTVVLVGVSVTVGVVRGSKSSSVNPNDGLLVEVRSISWTCFVRVR